MSSTVHSSSSCSSQFSVFRRTSALFSDSDPATPMVAASMTASVFPCTLINDLSSSDPKDFLASLGAKPAWIRDRFSCSEASRKDPSFSFARCHSTITFSVRRNCRWAFSCFFWLSSPSPTWSLRRLRQLMQNLSHINGRLPTYMLETALPWRALCTKSCTVRFRHSSPPTRWWTLVFLKFHEIRAKKLI